MSIYLSLIDFYLLLPIITLSTLLTMFDTNLCLSRLTYHRLLLPLASKVEVGSCGEVVAKSIERVVSWLLGIPFGIIASAGIAFITTVVWNSRKAFVRFGTRDISISADASIWSFLLDRGLLFRTLYPMSIQVILWINWEPSARLLRTSRFKWAPWFRTFERGERILWNCVFWVIQRQLLLKAVHFGPVEIIKTRAHWWFHIRVLILQLSYLFHDFLEIFLQIRRSTI